MPWLSNLKMVYMPLILCHTNWEFTLYQLCTARLIFPVSIVLLRNCYFFSLSKSNLTKKCFFFKQIGSPFQFTVGPLQDGGAHRVHAGGPGLERGIQGQPSDFNVWTREAGHGSLAIAVEGPSKAEVEFKDRKDGSCHVSYVVEEPGEYSVGIRFNDQHIPGSPYKVTVLKKFIII